MPTTTALVLVYDIRGFTAASRRLATADLGAFATGAHRVVLDLFASHPPTFVKNLGDGHLLLWEVGDSPDPALVAAVVDGAARARTAFAAWATAQAQAGSPLPTRVGIGVALGEVSRSDDYYGVALNLASRLQNLARPEGLAVDRRVFESAIARDEETRAAFRRSRVRLKGLGSTTVFVDRPFSWARLARKAALVGLVLLAPVLYALAADGGVGVPAGEAIRTLFDRYDASVLRPVRSPEDVAAAADRQRRSLARGLEAARQPDGRIAADLKEPTPENVENWAAPQALCALLRAPHLGREELRPHLAALDALFEPSRVVRAGGVLYGWMADDRRGYTQLEPALWTTAALAAALGRPGLLTAEERPTFEARLRVAQEATAIHRPLDTGGWNMFPNQVRADRASPYATILALLALLETRAAGQPWEGRVELRDELVARTADWLGSRFLADANPPGWRRTTESSDRVSQGLSFQAFALLLRAEEEAGVAVPDEVLGAMRPQLEALSVRAAEDAYDAGEFILEFTTHEGRPEKRNEAINFLWHPWAVEACVRWLARAERMGAPREQVVRVRRSLGHLVAEIGDAQAAQALGGYTFVAAEALYGLSSVPPR